MSSSPIVIVSASRDRGGGRSVASTSPPSQPVTKMSAAIMPDNPKAVMPGLMAVPSLATGRMYQLTNASTSTTAARTPERAEASAA